MDPSGADDRPRLRVRSLPDLIALVAVALGFEPRESLVVVAVSGRRAGFHVRVDLPARRARSGRDALVDHLATVLAVQQVSRVAVLAFTDAAPADRAARPVTDLLGAVAARLERDGREVLDAVHVGGGRYRSLVCPEPDCCPAEGTAFDPTTTLLRAEATLAGIGVAPDRTALAARVAAVQGAPREESLRATGLAEREVVASLGLRGPRSLRRPPDRALRAGSALGSARVGSLLDRLLAAGAGRGADVPVADAAALAVWCSVVRFRDVAWLRMDRDNAGAHLALWSGVARQVVPPYEPAVLCLAGFAAWLSGDGATAWCAVDRAQQADPGYRMAALLADLLGRCVPPDVWEPPPAGSTPDALLPIR